MSISKFNAEGYYDPTAYEALTRIEQAAKRTAYKPMVFICSPYAGDIERNVRKAQGYCRYAVSKNCIPIAPHLLFTQFLDEDDEEQRSLGIFFGMVLMGKCSEVWAFGGKITKGMSVEIEKAKQRGLHIRYFNDRCEEVQSYGVSKKDY